MASLSIDDGPPPAGTDSTAVDWDTLPAEVIDNVFDRLTVDDLKTCRLVNKRTSSLATPGVFRKVHLSRNMRSLKNLESIAYHSQLGYHVHCLVWHRYGLMDLAEDRTDPVWSQEHKLLQASDPDEESPRMLQFQETYGRELMDQHAFREYSYSSWKFRQLLSSLECLRDLIYTCDVDITYSAQPLFPEAHPLVQRTGLRNATRAGGWDLLNEWPTLRNSTSMGYVELACLGLWECILSRHPHRFCDFLRGANHVKITFNATDLWVLTCGYSNPKEWFVDPCHMLRELTKHLTGTVKLSLGFDMTWEYTPKQRWRHQRGVATISYMTRQLLTSHFQNVRELTLTNIITDELELCEFVRRHEPTVSLTFQEVRLRDGLSGRILDASVSKKRVTQLLKPFLSSRKLSHMTT